MLDLLIRSVPILADLLRHRLLRQRAARIVCHTVFLGVAATSPASPASAQTALAQSVPALTAPRLVVASPVESPITLRAVRVRTEISGRSALTSVELTFFNPNPRQLEGELQFPLREGQAVVGMAMDVNGVLREAVPVDKARGEAVFEDVTRTRIDPALLSNTQGNNYKLRVYPIAPNSEKVVVLRYSEWLAMKGRGLGGSVYRLPLDYAQRLSALSVSIHVDGVGARPEVVASDAVRGLDMPAFERAGDGYRFDLARRDVNLRGALELRLAPSAEGSVTTQRRDGRTFFLAQVPVAMVTAPRALPSVVTLVWDSSGSGAQRDHGREFALLDAYFARARNIDVRLVRLRDAAEPQQLFNVSGADWRALRRSLEATVYDGATNLGAFESQGASQSAGEVLLFSDGLSNFGAAIFPASKVAVFTVSAAVRNDSARLRHIAEASAGRFIDLLDNSQEAAAALLLNASSRMVAMESNGATRLVAASSLPSDGGLTVAGELTAPKTTLRVLIVHANGRRQNIDVVIDGTRVGAHNDAPDRHSAANKTGDSLAGVGQAAQAWARLQIAALEGEYDLNRAEIRRLGSEFSIVTRETSLIILDRAQDYARHHITPPAELASEVARLAAQMQQVEQAGATAQIDRVARLFADRQSWWARDFPKDAAPRQEAKKDAQIASGSLQAGIREERAREADTQSTPMDAAKSAVRRDALGGATPASPTAAPAPAQVADSAMRLLAKSVPAQAVEGPAATIRLRPAAIDAPYAARMRNASASELYRIYLDERADYANSTAFMLDVADILFERGQGALGVRVLSNLAEMDLENRQVLRILGQRLMQATRADLAVPVFRKVLALAPDEPQSHRDLGLALAADHQPQAAIDALYDVVRKPWPRFPEVELIALTELNAIAASHAASGGTPLDTSRIDPRLLKNMPLDLRATLSWDADNTDIDLWVTDPNGERAYYGHPLTRQGGRMSRDITGGYGPEEFSLRHALPGKYIVQAQFYGHRQQIVAGATTIQLALTTGFGTAGQKEQSATLRLKSRNDQVLVGEFEVQPLP